jgi:hypothetical protein
MNDELRRTGRTTEILKAAAAAKTNGHHIRVVVPHSQLIKHLLHIAGDNGLNLASADFVTVSNQSLRGMRRAHVFIDHTVWEQTPMQELEAFEELLARMP